MPDEVEFPLYPDVTMLHAGCQDDGFCGVGAVVGCHKEGFIFLFFHFKHLFQLDVGAEVGDLFKKIVGKFRTGNLFYGRHVLHPRRKAYLPAEAF